MSVMATYEYPVPNATTQTTGARIHLELVIVVLWSILGLILTALVPALGFGAEIGQLLAMAG